MDELVRLSGVTEKLKATDLMKWTGLMNTLKSQAEGNDSERADLQLIPHAVSRFHCLTGYSHQRTNKLNQSSERKL